MRLFYRPGPADSIAYLNEDDQPNGIVLPDL